VIEAVHRLQALPVVVGEMNGRIDALRRLQALPVVVGET
jgi:hypothetical protein